MNSVYVGKIANTHGLKGEIRILSTFYVPESTFKVGNVVRINDNDYVIKSYRKHKNFDMVTFEGCNSIEDVISLKGSSIYINRDLIEEEIVTDFIGMDVFYKDKKGKVVDVLEGVKYPYFSILMNDKKYLVPVVDNFYSKIPDGLKIVDMDGLLDEN